MTAVDITDPSTYARGIPHDVFRRMRDNEPVASLTYEGRPFWSVTRYEDLVTVTRDAATYSSARGMSNIWDLTPEQMEARRSLIDTDPPEHVRLRKLGMPAFTGRRVRDYEGTARSITGTLLDAALAEQEIDVVEAISAPLPIRVLVGILGVPAEDADLMVELTDHLVSGGAELPPDAYGNTTPLELLPFNSPAAFALFDYGRKLGEERRQNPHDDVVTALVTGMVDGDQLTEAEYANMFQLLVFAGNETTRTAISNGIRAFMDNPEELEKLHRDPDLIPNAVEEVIRYASPVLHMRRTATRDTVLHDVAISEGDKVVIWYASANFDERVFDEPLTFDVERPIRPKMISFGAQGPHHCLGAPLARLEIRILLEGIVERGLRFESTGPMVRTPSNFVNGITSLPGRLVTRS
ncbi:MAG: cytochrome P450 [Actinobacteria bacterium]|nr:cytochrome P450 [Actinomycetota bacterium]